MLIATCCDFEPRSWRGVLDATLCDQVYQRLATGWRFSPSTPVSSTIKTDHHDIAEILLKVVLNTINLKKNVSHIMAFNELLWLDRLQFSWKKMSHCFNWILDLTKVKLILLYPRSPRGVYCFTSVRPSKIFFVAFFSVTVDGRNLIFGHKCHIGIPYCG